MAQETPLLALVAMAAREARILIKLMQVKTTLAAVGGRAD
jgi:hypothetical protein